MSKHIHTKKSIYISNIACAYLFIPLCHIHGALIVVVLVGALVGIDREQLVVGPQSVPLCVTVGKNT